MPPIDHLNLFISNRDEYGWSKISDGNYVLSSGRWKFGAWSHSVVLVQPRNHPAARDAAVLYITGGNANALDIAEAQAIADRSGVPVALLFHVPNQPLYDRIEDDLIAHTFERFIETGDRDWPLLFPMVRAAVRAMDMLQELGMERFIVTGASKRGWTSWLTAATGDPRLVGVAPMVIDNLNFPAQMQHQVESWGGYSEQISDYTSRELQDEMDSVRGFELVQMMDPIQYVDRIRCPILIVNGSNDRYWTVDALSLYWGKLPGTKRCLIVPNAGHLLGDKRLMIETLGAFARASAAGDVLPDFGARLERGTATVEAPGAQWTRIWAAASESLDFRDAGWSITADGVSFPKGNVAVMAEARFQDGFGDYSLSTPVRVLTAP